jgi:hypothetical protein
MTSDMEPDTRMFGGWLRGTGFLLSGLVLLGLAMVAPANADGPAPEFKLLTDADDTFTSPDRQVRVEQYAKDMGDEGYLHQFWTFDDKHQHAVLLNPGENTELAGYPAGFRFSPNSQWLVRMQTLGAGYQTLFLYRRNGNEFSSATPKPLGDLAWDYFFGLPVSKKLHRDPKERDSLNHVQAVLIKGLEDNYAWMGQHWPDSRYLVISLSFDAQGEDKPAPWIEAWRCVYDLKTGAFSVPPAFAEHNAKAFKTPRPGRK